MSALPNEESVALVETSEVAVMIPSAAAALNKSEVEAQLDAAHKYPRSMKRFLSEAITLATINEEIAASCMYALPRGEKPITGPSVRLAEICASAWGNLHIGARVVAVEEKEVVGQGVAWDLEKNVRISTETRRRITDKKGKRYNDDMITMTGNAAASISLRNSVFRVIPKAYVNEVYNRARAVAVGDASTLSEKRATVIERIVKMGALKDRILLRVGKPSVEDITLDDLEILIGIGTAIKNGDIRADEAFPAAGPSTTERSTVNLDSIKPSKEENRGHGDEQLRTGSEFIDMQMSESLANLFKDSLKPALRKNSDKYLSDWLKSQEIVNGEGVGDLLKIRRASYNDVKEAAVMHARSIQ